MKKILIIAVAVLAALTISVGAFVGVSANGSSSDVQSVGTVNLAKGKVHDGALYGAGDNILINGTVKGDVYCAGQNVIINGDIEGDVVCGAQTIQVDGKVSGDVRIAGQTITISGEIAGSLSTLGQTILINDGAYIGRDFNGAGQTVGVNGRVGRDVAVASEQISISGAVGRNLNGFYDKVRVYDGATIAGDAIFEAKAADIADGVVSGETKRTEPTYSRYNASFDGSGVAVAYKVFYAVSTFTLAMVLILILPGHVRRAAGVDGQRLLLSILLGVAVFISTPFLAVLLAITIIGLPVAALVMLIWLVVLILSLPVFSYYVGKQILQKQTKNSIAIMSLGAFIVLLAAGIPFIGGMVTMFGGSAGIGMIVFALSRRWVKPNYTAKG